MAWVWIFLPWFRTQRINGKLTRLFVLRRGNDGWQTLWFSIPLRRL